MEILSNILLDHAGRYPMMEPTDAVKLIYQNEFGGGHLIRDVDSCLNYLRREYESVIQSPDAPLSEDIGNGMHRINLNALDHAGYTIDQLGTDFIRSANAHQGSLDRFLQKLEILLQLTKTNFSHLENYRQPFCFAFANIKTPLFFFFRKFTSNLLSI